MNNSYKWFIYAAALIVTVAICSIADQKISVKTEVGHNRNTGLEPNLKTGEVLVYWEKDGGIYTAVLKPKKKNPQKFKLGKANKITPDGGSYKRPDAIYNPATGGYLLVCDTWAGDLSIPAGLPGSLKIPDLGGPPAQGDRSDITLINIKANGKRKGKPKRAAKGKQVLLVSSIEATHSNSSSDSPDGAAFRIYFAAMSTGFGGALQILPPTGRKPGIWTVDCTSAGKCGKPQFLYSVTSSNSSTVFTQNDKDLDSGRLFFKHFHEVEAGGGVFFGNDKPVFPRENCSISGHVKIDLPGEVAPAYFFEDKFGENMLTDVHRFPDVTYLVSLKVKDKATGDWNVWHAHIELCIDCSGDTDVRYIKIYKPGYPYQTILDSLTHNMKEGSKAPSPSADDVYLWAALALSNGKTSLAKYNQNAGQIGQRKFLFNHNLRIEEIKLTIASLASKCVVLWVENKAGTVSRTASDNTTELNLHITAAK